MHKASSTLVITVGVLTLLIIGAGPATAGGALWYFEGRPLNAEAVLVPGDDVRALAAVGLREVGPKQPGDAFSAGPQHGPFYGYISPRKGAAWGPYAPPLPDEAMMVGEVRFTETKDPQVLRVSLDFVMPDLEPGYYTLHHCNVPCTRQIGSLMSTPITVVEDRGQAHLAVRIDRLERRDQAIRPRLDHRFDKLSSENAGLESDLAALENRIVDLEAKPVAAPPRLERADPSPVAWGLGGALTALLAVIGLRSIRRGLGRRAEPNVG